MRICHGVTEIAGQMGILSGALKRRGHISVGYNIFHSYLGYQDHLINTIPSELQNVHKHIIHFFDVFHFHYASTLLHDYADLPILKAENKKMVMHHWGNDVRFHQQARINNPYVYTGDSPPDAVIHERLTKIGAYVREAIVQDHEVLPYVAPYYEKVHVVPIAIDIAKFHPLFPSPSQKTPLIIHAPTNPEFKGTYFVEEAIERLRAQYQFEYRRIERMNHKEARKLYREADVIIDQIRCGSYGLFCVEAMSLGKPVVGYIREDLVSKFPADLPVWNANPDTIYDRLKLLLENPFLRHELGVRGRLYAEKYHASSIVAEQLIQIYTNLRP